MGINMNIKELNIKLNETLKYFEDFRLADDADESLGLGDMYMVDNKEELIAGLDKLNLADSIGIIQGKQEITITMEDEDSYTFFVDRGENQNNWQPEANGPVFKEINKEAVVKLIDLVVK